MQIQGLKSKQGNLREQNKNMSMCGQTRPCAHEHGAFDMHQQKKPAYNCLTMPYYALMSH